MSQTPDRDSAILGLCPKCQRWFECDAWFDRTVALPCCDRCRLPPVKLAYTGRTPDSHAGLEQSREVWIG